MRLAAKALFRLLVDHQHAPAGIGQFSGGNQASQTAADHDDIGGLHVHSP
jgi:hypothetical protein